MPRDGPPALVFVSVLIVVEATAALGQVTWLPLVGLKQNRAVPERVFDCSPAKSTAKTLKAVMFNSTDVQLAWLAAVIAAVPISHTLKEISVRPTTDLSNDPVTGVEAERLQPRGMFWAVVVIRSRSWSPLLSARVWLARNPGLAKFAGSGGTTGVKVRLLIVRVCGSTVRPLLPLLPAWMAVAEKVAVMVCTLATTGVIVT